MRRAIFTFLLLCVLVIFTYPFFWMLLGASKTNKEIYQPTLVFPSNFDWNGIIGLFNSDYISYTEVLGNSLLIASAQALLATFISAGVGFALAKLNFRGKAMILFIAFFLILVPKQILAIPTMSWLSFS